jgi:mannose/fructose/N-acetylgalactosamine-specific phosphotransferase system component IIB
MTVVHMRIDNRLIHGQVTASWANAIQTNHLIVTNDQVSRDPIQKMLLPQAARGIQTSVLSVVDTLNYVKSEQGQKERIFVLAKLPQDALRLLEGGLKPEEINVGNQAPTPGTKFKMVTHSIAVTPEDAQIYRAIADKGFRLTSKMMPSDRGSNFLETLEKNKL